MAISFVFGPFFRPKMTTLKEAVPMGPQRPSLCFWNQQNNVNGISQLANSNYNFLIFCPPLVSILLSPQILKYLLKIFQSKQIFYAKSFLLQKIFWLKNNVGQKNFLVSTFFSTQTSFIQNIFCPKNIFVGKIILG